MYCDDNISGPLLQLIVHLLQPAYTTNTTTLPVLMIHTTRDLQAILPNVPTITTPYIGVNRIHLIRSILRYNYVVHRSL